MGTAGRTGGGRVGIRKGCSRGRLRRRTLLHIRTLLPVDAGDLKTGHAGADADSQKPNYPSLVCRASVLTSLLTQRNKPPMGHNEAQSFYTMRRSTTRYVHPERDECLLTHHLTPLLTA